MSVGLGRSDAILRWAINLIAKPSPTAPATRSVSDVSGRDSVSNWLTNAHVLGVANALLEPLGSKSYKSCFVNVI